VGKVHFNDLTEYHNFLGLAAPEHPLFSVISSSDFYSISLKNITAGEIHYGRTQYDCRNGIAD